MTNTIQPPFDAVIEIAEALGKLKLSPPNATDRYAFIREWAPQLEKAIAELKSPAGQSVSEAREHVTLGFVRAKAHGAKFLPPAPSVFREYGKDFSRHGVLEVDDNADVNIFQEDPDRPAQGAYVQAWRYVSNDELAGYMSRLVLESSAYSTSASGRYDCGDLLDDAIHTAAERAIPTQATEEQIETLSQKASDVNNAGVLTQITFLIATYGPEEAFAIVREAAFPSERDVDRSRAAAPQG